MNRSHLSTATTDYSVAMPIRVDYVGAARLSLWAFLRKAREEDRLGQVLHGGCPPEFKNGQVEDEILSSINVTPAEAELFSQALDCAMSVFGHDRLTLCHAITPQLSRISLFRTRDCQPATPVDNHPASAAGAIRDLSKLVRSQVAIRRTVAFVRSDVSGMTSSVRICRSGSRRKPGATRSRYS